MFGWSHGIQTLQRRCNRVGLFFGSLVSTFLNMKPFSLLSLLWPLSSRARWLFQSRDGSKAVVFLASISPLCPCPRSAGSTLTCSGCSCCVVFTFLSHCLPALAGVAVLSTTRGHHRASCCRAGVLGRRGFALESAVARVCREAAARVSANVFLRDLDLPIGAMISAGSR